VTHRFTHGLAVQGSFTISKNLERVSVLNNQDINVNKLLDTKLEKRLTQYDAPRAFAGVVSYELPLGRGKRFGSHMPAVVNGIAGNWNLNVQYTAHSGYPFAFPNAAPLVAQSARLTDDQRNAAAQKQGHPQFDPTTDVWFNTSIFPNQAQPPFTERNFPTRFPDVRSKALDVWEISVQKEFPIRERLRLQFRTDFHNAFNHPWFGNLGSNDVTSSQFGHLAVAAIDDTSEPRLIVLAMKILF
jgi:hypothetical protein